MFSALFGWRKASKCKKLIKKVQCRLRLLKNKRTAIVKQLREDIAHLLRNGHDRVAFRRVDQLYMDENLKEVYELLDSFCDFVLMKLSFIRKHRDCPNDINEAVSSLVFASARFGNMPELQALRQLFAERYGQKFATCAVELLPGNLVNLQLVEKLSMNSVSDYAKNRLLDEIFRESFFQPGLLAIEYKRSPQFFQAAKPDDTKSMVTRSMESPDAKQTEQNSSHFEFQSPTTEPLKIKDGIEEDPSLENSTEQSLVYLDDVEEFKSPATKIDQQDQRMFIFKPKSPNLSSARKRQRRSLSKDHKHLSLNDTGYEVYYGGSPLQRKHPKKVHFKARESELDGPVQSFRFRVKPEHLVRLASLPQKREQEREGIDLNRSISLPTKSPFEMSNRVLLSPGHVHPKLPDYDELEAKFRALKKVHQESKLMMRVR